MHDCLIEKMLRHIGQTVTVFTASGGLSGNGFTGVLAGIHCGCIRLITDIGAPPSCPVGSSCDGRFGDCERDAMAFNGRRGWGWGCGWRGRHGCGHGCGRWGWGGYNWLGSVAEIPVDRIVNFTHNSI